MELDELSQKVAPPNGDQLLFEIHRAFVHAGRRESHTTFHHLLNALHLLVNQRALYVGTPGLDHPNENGAMVPRELLPQRPEMRGSRRQRLVTTARTDSFTKATTGGQK